MSGDVSRIEYGSWAPLLFLIILLGIVPALVFGMTNDGVIEILSVFG